MLDQKDEALTYPEIMYSDCNLDKWLKDESLVPEFNVGTGNWIENGSKNVLLTGSAGFLGRHILLCLLQDEKCGKVFCHLRRKSEGMVMYASSQFHVSLSIIITKWTLVVEGPHDVLSLYGSISLFSD